MRKITLYEGDCLKQLKNLKEQSVALAITDLPYGTTKNDWDIKIDLPTLWREYDRVLKSNGVVLFWSQMPFSAELVMSRPDMFRYEWIIEKTKGTGFLNARRMPLKVHENVLVFYRSLPIYNPQKTTGHKPVHSYTKYGDNGSNYGSSIIGISGGGQYR